MASSPRTTVPSLGCGYVVCLVLGVGGLGLLYVAQSHFSTQRQPEGWIAAVFGAALAGGALAMIGPMQRAVRRAKERLRRELEQPDQPWTWESAWTDPNGIPQAERRHGRALLVFAVAALVLSSPAVFAFGKELRKGNQLVWLVLVFPAVSVGIFTVAATDAWRRRKYGTARFVPAERPVALGGELSGIVSVTRPVEARGAGRAALECWRNTITRSGGKTRHQETVIAHTERELAPGEWITQGGESRLFLQLPVRGGEPTTMAAVTSEQPGHEWRLRIETPTPGADFVAEFVLPVFPVAGVAGLAPAGASSGGQPRDRAAAFRVARIEEVTQPGARGGTALRFAVGVGRPLLFGPLVMAAGLGAVALLLWFSPVPGIFAGFLMLFALLSGWVVASLWGGGGEQVWVEGGALCVQHGRAAPRRIAMADILRVETSRNVGVGGKQFYRVVARLRPKNERHFPARAPIAGMILGDEAAAEVVHWLEERLTEPGSGAARTR